MSTAVDGLAGAIMGAGRGAAPEPFPTTEQLDLIADGTVQGKNGLERLRIARRRHQRGRPPGAKNKRNGRVADWFIATYGDPLSAMGQIMAMPPDALMQLLTELQGNDAKHKPLRAVDVIRLKLEAAAHAAPYIHGKQPITMEVNGKRDLFVVMQNGSLTGSGISESEAEALVEEFGLAAFDTETLLVRSRDQIEDADYTEVGGDGASADSPQGGAA